MADIEQPVTPISQQLADLARTGKSSEALQLERELRRLQNEPDQTGLR